MIRSILVLESPWDVQSVRSTSVWPFISEFSRIYGPEAFHQTFTDTQSFRHWVHCFNREKCHGDKLLYIAAHGSQGRIAGLKRKINGRMLSSILKDCSSISHAHFGSCFFGTDSNLRSLLSTVPHLRYVAGYSKDVDWIESMSLDLLMLARLSRRELNEKHARTASMMKELVSTVSGLSDALGFTFAYRYGADRVFSSTARAA